MTLKFSQEEAERLHHPLIAPEHVLLGLMRVKESLARQVLIDVGVNQEKLIQVIEEFHPASEPADSTRIDLDDMTKQLLELSVEEARKAGHYVISPEHILLGIVGQQDSLALKALGRFTISPFDVREKIQKIWKEPPDK